MMIDGHKAQCMPLQCYHAPLLPALQEIMHHHQQRQGTASLEQHLATVTASTGAPSLPSPNV